MKVEVGRWCLFCGEVPTFVGAFSSEKAALCAGKDFTNPQAVFLRGEAESIEPKHLASGKKVKLMAPALITLGEDDGNQLRISSALYSSAEEAEKYWDKGFVSWPALQKDNGMYEVPVW